MSLQSLLNLRAAPVAVAFRASPPPGMSRVDKAGPSGCSYWSLAAEGKAFYTQAEDHFNCPVGAHTHNVAMPPEKMKELEGLIGTMVGLQYLKMEEVPQIPHRTEPFGVALYAPLESAPFPPDVIMLRVNAKQAMLLGEAAHAAGVGSSGAAMLRPTCAIIPEALQAARANLSLACIGNRVYTGLEDGEMYFAIPGPRLAEIIVKLANLVTANQELEKYHASRRTKNQ